MFYLPGKRTHSPIAFAGGRLRGRIVDEYDCAELRALLADPDSIATQPDSRILVESRRSRVARLSVGGIDIVVKENLAKSTLKALKRSLVPSRAARAWHAAHTLEAVGVDTAAPIAYVERRYGPLRGRSWLVTAALDGLDAQTFLTDATMSKADRDRMIDKIAGMYARLHRANVTHGDDRLQNVIIVNGRPHLIDLDVTVLHPRWSYLRHRYMRRDVRSLLHRWRDRPEIESVLRASLHRHGIDYE